MWWILLLTLGAKYMYYNVISYGFQVQGVVEPTPYPLEDCPNAGNFDGRKLKRICDGQVVIVVYSVTFRCSASP